jgi:hypothetical protein
MSDGIKEILIVTGSEGLSKKIAEYLAEDLSGNNIVESGMTDLIKCLKSEGESLHNDKKKQTFIQQKMQGKRKIY